MAVSAINNKTQESMLKDKNKIFNLNVLTVEHTKISVNQISQHFSIPKSIQNMYIQIQQAYQ